jgi:two-component system, OmpR family, phosphate regulon sensor histidine kinase PhoR
LLHRAREVADKSCRGKEALLRSRTEIVRAQWQLWGVAFTIISGLAAVLIFLATSAQPLPQSVFLPSRVWLAIGLGGLCFAFTLYAIDRERNLHRLAERLTREQVEAEHLAARLEHLHELTRERDTSAALLAGSADGVAVADGDLRITRFNRSMQELTLRAEEDALGKRADAVFQFIGLDGSSLEKMTHPMRAVAADGVARKGLELRLLLPDGTERWVSATFSPIGDSDARLILISLRDIAEQKELERTHRDFVSMAAHELRSPLTAIKGFTRTLMMKADKLSEERRNEYLSVVNEQSNRLARLVEDLMQVSRIDAGRVSLHREDLDLGETISALVEQFRGKWTGRTIRVSKKGKGLYAHADPHKFEEILINLIDNAVKYSPAGTPVVVSLEEDGPEIAISVRDRGVGIPSDEVPNLFQKFARVSSAATAEVPGTGLGLYIVKGFVEAHGGRVSVDSTPGEGSTFTFSLPAAHERRPAHAI